MYGIWLRYLSTLTSGNLFGGYAVLKTGSEWDLASILSFPSIIHQDEMSMVVIQARSLRQQTGSHVIRDHALC